jgi:hypothetical protein
MKALRITNGILLAFIALNAFGGGYYGMSGAPDVPLEWLQGSPFTSYFLPGLFLFLIVGGTCTVGAIALFRNSMNARRVSFVCGSLLIAWIVVQVTIIGYVSWMQPAIFISGAFIITTTWFLPKHKS